MGTLWHPWGGWPCPSPTHVGAIFNPRLKFPLFPVRCKGKGRKGHSPTPTLAGGGSVVFLWGR